MNSPNAVRPFLLLSKYLSRIRIRNYLFTFIYTLMGVVFFVFLKEEYREDQAGGGGPTPPYIRTSPLEGLRVAGGVSRPNWLGAAFYQQLYVWFDGLMLHTEDENHQCLPADSFTRSFLTLLFTVFVRISGHHVLLSSGTFDQLQNEKVNPKGPPKGNSVPCATTPAVRHGLEPEWREEGRTV
eukprot:gene1943-1181_t